MDNFTVSIVLPSYNEAHNVVVIAEKLQQILQQYHDYELIFVDDGSRDETLQQLKQLRQNNSKIQYISFARNFGHQNALRAGLDFANGDCVICMDADMQHPPELVPELIAKWQEGFDIVYTIRQESGDESFFKKFTSNFFYFLINALSGINLKAGAADYRLMDKQVVLALRQYTEKFIFYRGIVATMGFNQTYLEYVPQKRLHGKSKYSVTKMMMFALDGITAFSTLPLRLASVFGILISFFSFVYAAYAVLVRFIGGYTVPGWSSLLFGVFFLGGIQLVMIGILGEYIGKLFFEIKKRPNYIIKQTSLS